MMKKTTLLLATSAMVLTPILASAETLRWARAGDSLTLDPHAQNEGPTHALAHQIYEPLIIRDMFGQFQGALATEWGPKADDPNVWVFSLREGVTFHDGSDFTAEDVVFSFERAKSETSAMKELLTSITEIRAVDDMTVEFVTAGPNPILPNNFTNLFIMDKGWTEEMDSSSMTDLDAAKALMEEAGYADGFSITLDCPNDRYINDEAICQAAVGMMGQIGITVNLDAKPKAQHFPLIQNGETNFYMLGWGVPTYDSEYIFNFLVHSRGGDRGSWNNTGFTDAMVDEKIVSLASETDLSARNATIGEIWSVVQDQQLYLPVHHQVLNWGSKNMVSFPNVDPEDQPKFKFFEMN